MPKQKKKRKFFISQLFANDQKNGDLCGHKWPEGVICACENFFHIKNFWKTVSNGAKQMEMMLLQVIFQF